MLDEKNSTDQSLPESNATADRLTQFIYPLHQSRFWIQLFAGCLIFYGALLTVTGLGILVAWLPIWVGVLLFMASKSIRYAYLNNDEQALIKTLQRFKSIFTILGLASVMLISVSLYLLKYAVDKSLF